MDANGVFRIPLSRGREALCDNGVFDQFRTVFFRDGTSLTVRPCDHYWAAVPNRHNLYATAIICGRAVVLHRLITQAPAEAIVDHRNRRTLDNRSDNLRICTFGQNAANSNNRSYYGKSKFRGVSTSGKRWRAQIGKKRIGIGLFRTELQAALAYDAALIYLYGEDVNTNFERVLYELSDKQRERLRRITEPARP